MTEKYTLLIYVVHSCLEHKRGEIIVSKETTVENFRDNQTNNQVCLDIHKWVLENFKYDLSWNQMANGINQFLLALKNPVPVLE